MFGTALLRRLPALLSALYLVALAAAATPADKDKTMPTKTAETQDIKTTHIRLLVTHFDSEFRFFRDILGFKPTFGKEGEAYADFDCNGFTIALFKQNLMSQAVGTGDKPATPDAQDRVALIFGVQDVDATAARLESQGIKLVTKPHDRRDWGIRVAHFRDPDGNLIEINHGLGR